MRMTNIVRLTLVAGAAFAIAGCGSRPAATNTTGNTTALGNDLGAPMNDASALESTGNASIAPPPSSNMTNSAETETIAPPSGNASVQSNIAGM